MDLMKLFKLAVEKKASDLHLIAGLPPVLRIDGNLIKLDNEAEIDQKKMEDMVFELLENDQIERFKKNKDLDFGLEQDDKTRLRVNICYEKGRISLVARVIPNDIPNLETIDMPSIVMNLLSLKQGLILVTGPTGCGKSTTLASMINFINQNYCSNIITFEDPVEYLFTPDKSIITQRQLGSDMTSFAEGLKHALRQDPNVVMVGEMRDLETIANTVTLAETGHLVFATLHTYSAAQTVDRIIDIFPPYQQNQIRAQLSMTLAAVISQRLLPKIGGGRVAAREILVNTPAVANLIRENKIPQIRTVIETSSKDGMVSLDQHIKKLYKEKLVEKKMAQLQMENPGQLDNL